MAITVPCFRCNALRVSLPKISAGCFSAAYASALLCNPSEYTIPYCLFSHITQVPYHSIAEKKEKLVEGKEIPSQEGEGSNNILLTHNRCLQVSRETKALPHAPSIGGFVVVHSPY